MKSELDQIREGDVVTVSPAAVAKPGRSGVVEEILGAPGHEHFRVRWEDGQETILYPSAGVTIRHAPAKRRARPATRS